MEEQKIELKIINMADIQSQEIEWLWYPFIPYGKLTIIQGDPGDGKTTLVLNLAAKLSKGIGLDEDMQVSEPMNIIYQTAEDGLADTVKPRLEAGDADCEKIMVIDESEKSLSMVDERLEQAIIQTNARLLILDPIQAYLGAKTKDISINLFMDFDIETVSDVLSLLFKLDEQVDMNFDAEKDENGEFIPSTVKLSFQNAAINQKLCTYLKAKQIKENLENAKEKLSAKDDYTETINEIEQNIEDIKNHLVDDNMVVKKETDGITVKLFPQ